MTKISPFYVLSVGDEEMIQKVINNNQKVLSKIGFKPVAKNIFTKICEKDFDHDKNMDMYHFITELFNSWCLWCEPPSNCIIDQNGDYTSYSANPYDPDKEK